MIKVPAVVSSVALDSFPALLAAGLMGAGPGALVAGMGHLVSALVGGMPLGPFHVLIAVEMAAILWLFAKLYQTRNKLIAVGVFIFLNSAVAPAPFILFFGAEFYVGLVPAVFLASFMNGVLAWIALPRLMPIFQKFDQSFEVKV
ncbi:putative membrane protein [Bacillus ectoiniformans]|nr:putative membrane protein [Bacillus ectoiniformans]